MDMGVTRMRTYLARDTIATLRELLKHARAGYITGVIVGWRCKDGTHHGTLTGYYAKDRITALGAVTKLSREIAEEYEAL
jgi:hypothetical protein